jgi:hypothetical protein
MKIVTDTVNRSAKLSPGTAKKKKKKKKGRIYPAFKIHGQVAFTGQCHAKYIF